MAPVRAIPEGMTPNSGLIIPQDILNPQVASVLREHNFSDSEISVIVTNHEFRAMLKGEPHDGMAVFDLGIGTKIIDELKIKGLAKKEPGSRKIKMISEMRRNIQPTFMPGLQLATVNGAPLRDIRPIGISKNENIVFMSSMAPAEGDADLFQQLNDLIARDAKEFNMKLRMGMIPVDRLSEQQRFKLAERAAWHFDFRSPTSKNDGLYISANIQLLDIKDEKKRIHIARIAVALEARIDSIRHPQNSGFSSKYIHNFGITDQEALIELAMDAAHCAGEATSLYIRDYGITDEKALIEIAKEAAANNGEGTSKYIGEYGIKDEKALIEIAKIAAANSGGGTSAYMIRYDITNEEALIEIARIAAANDGEGTSKNIGNYFIKDEKARIEIAKIAVAAHSSAVKYIRKYRIRDEKALIDIAKMVMAKSGSDKSMYIREFDIKDEKARIEIAKIAAANEGWAISIYIGSYDITDEKALIEIAKIAATKEVKHTLENIKNYGISEEGIREVKLFILADRMKRKGFSEDVIGSKYFRELLVKFINQSNSNLSKNLEFIDLLTPDNVEKMFQYFGRYCEAFKTSAYRRILFGEYVSLLKKGDKKAIDNFVWDYLDYISDQSKGINREPSSLSRRLINETGAWIVNSSSVSEEEFIRITDEFKEEKIPERNFANQFSIEMARAVKKGSMNEEEIIFLNEKIGWIEEAIIAGKNIQDVDAALKAYPETDRPGEKPSQGHMLGFFKLLMLRNYRTNAHQKGLIDGLIGKKGFISDEDGEIADQLIEVIEEIKPEADEAVRKQIEGLVFLQRLVSISKKFSVQSGERTIAMEFVPAKTRVDYFFGDMGENCTSEHPEELLNERFTPIRIIVKGKIWGCVHTLTLDINGKKALVIAGVEPKETLLKQIDPKGFIEKFIEGLIEYVAKPNGYDLVCFTTDEATISNRPAVKEELKKRMEGKDPIKQDVQKKFPQRGTHSYPIEDLKVFWKRP